MRRFHIAILGLLAACHASVLVAVTVDVSDDPPVGDAGDLCPTHCSLRQAIFHTFPGDTITFDTVKAPSPIRLVSGMELLIDKSLTIQGPGAGKMTISAQDLSRVVRVSNSDVVIRDVTLAEGLVEGLPGNDGVGQSGNDGNDGGSGGNIGGGCVLVDHGSLLLYKVAVRQCLARGGNGGNGSNGLDGSCLVPNPLGGCTTAVPGGSGGHGGVGGSGAGGAIFVDSGGTLYLDHASLLDGQAVGGVGGTGGNGGAGAKGVPAGSPGGGGLGGEGLGGAIYKYGTALSIKNSTLANSAANGGAGGDAATFPTVGKAGFGGYAAGGLLYYEGDNSTLYFSTLVNGRVEGGVAGAVGSGGLPGMQFASALNSIGPPTVVSAIIVGVQPDAELCNGIINIEGGSANLSEDVSCSGFNLHASLAQTLRPLDTDEALPGAMPAWHGAAVDVATSCQAAGVLVGNDQQGTPRPQGAYCDIGAIEADYIFVGDFN